MHTTLRWAVGACAGLLCFRPALAAGQHADPGSALNVVMTYRLEYLADSTRFDACTVHRQVGGDLAGVPGRLSEPVRRLLDSAAGPCPRHREPGRSAVVLVDSVRTSGPVTHVYLTVVRGEYVHREDFSVVRAGGGDRLSVREVRIWGAVQAYPRYRPTSGR